MAKQRRGDVRTTKREHLSFDPNARKRATTYVREATATEGSDTAATDASTVDSHKSKGLATTRDLHRIAKMLRHDMESFRNCFSAKVQANATLVLNQLTDFPFPQITLFGDSVITDTVGGYQRTYFQASRKTAGVYRFSTHIRLNFLEANNVAEVLGFFAIGGTAIRPLRCENAKHTGDGGTGKILSTTITGTALLPVPAGAKVTVQLFIDTGAGVGDLAFAFDDSIYAFFDGERVKCEIPYLSQDLPTDETTYPAFL